HLEGVTGVVGGKIGDEHKLLAETLGLVIDRDVVDLDLRHERLPDRLCAATLRFGVERGQCAAPPAFFHADMPPSRWRAEARPWSGAACTAIAERSPNAQ